MAPGGTKQGGSFIRDARIGDKNPRHERRPLIGGAAESIPGVCRREALRLRGVECWEAERGCNFNPVDRIIAADSPCASSSPFHGRSAVLSDEETWAERRRFGNAIMFPEVLKFFHAR